MSTRSRRRASFGTLWVVVLAALTAFALIQRGFDDGSRGPLLAGLAFAGVGVGLLLRWRWARPLGALCFAALAATLGASLVAGWVRVEYASVLSLLVSGWAAFFLLSTRRRHDPPPDRGRLLAFGVALAVCVALAALLARLGAPTWLSLLTLWLALGFYEWRYAPRVGRWLAGALAPRPPDIDDAHAATFRAARLALARGDHHRVLALAARLPRTRTAVILDGLARMEIALAGQGPEHVLWSGDWVAAPALGPDIAAAAAALDVAARAAARVALLDALCADVTDDRPGFTRDFEPALGALSGRTFPGQPPASFVTWWQEQRPLLVGPAAATWATLRFIDAWCMEAAAGVARRFADPEVAELAALAAAVATPLDSSPAPALVSARMRALMLAPRVADELGLLLVGSPLSRELGTRDLVARLRLRLRLVDLVRRLWPAYQDALSTTRPFLLHVLTDCGARIAESVARFDAWWVDRRADQERFDDELGAAFLAVEAGDWELAEHAFQAATDAWPERQAGRFGLALGVEQRGAADEAQAVLETLVADEPGEALWRMKLGDLDLHRGDLQGALAHLEHAARLGGFVHGLSLRLGIVLSRLGRMDEARLHLEAELGPDATPEDVRGLAETIARLPVATAAAGAALDPSRLLFEDDDPGDDGPPPTFH